MVGGLAHVALGAEQHVERTVHFYAELLGPQRHVRESADHPRASSLRLDQICSVS